MVLAIIAVSIWQFLPKGEVAYAPKIENSIAIISFENLTGDDNNDNFQKSIPNLLILQQLIEKYPKEKEAHYELGYYYIGTGDGYKAIDEFEEVLKLDPTDRVSLNEIGLIYMRMEDYENAQEYLRKAIDAWPNDANLFETLAFVYWRMKISDEAIEAYKEAINIKPDFEFPYVGISCIYALHEDYDETIKWIDALISIASPRRKEVGYLWKGHILSWIGNFTQSFASYQRAYELSEAAGGGNQTIIAVYEQSALIYYEKGELELSRQWHERWHNFMPGFQQQSGLIQKFFYN